MHNRNRQAAFWLLCAPFLIGTAWAVEPRIADAPSPSPQSILTVTTASDEPVPGQLTLREAIALASQDPRDNLIRFDPPTFAGTPWAIRLSEPLVYDPPEHAQRDRIDAGGGTIVLRASPDTPAAVIVRRGSLTLRNLQIAGGGRGVLVVDCNEAALEYCRISACDGPGVAVYGSGHIDIRGGTINANRSHAVELHDTASAIMQSVTANRNAQSGLAAFGNSRCELDTCFLNDNAQWGIFATDQSRVRARRTDIARSGFAGLDAGGAATATLDGCRLTAGGRFGILASGQARVEVLRTEISEQASRGLELQAGASVLLHDTRVERSGNFGVVLFGRSSLRATGATISENRGHGLALRDQASAELSDCRLERNQYSGAGAPDASAGGRLAIRRCVFRGNGMRPIYRGPAHLDPPVPTVARIRDDSVLVRTAPLATIDLYADRAGEASRYLGTLTADARGQFEFPLAAVTGPDVITAAATTPDGHTSEFNVIAGRLDRSILAALLARTGPLSDDDRSGVDAEAPVHRWRPGSRVVFRFESSAPPHVRRYTDWFVEQMRDWTGGAIAVRASFDATAGAEPGSSVVPIRYAPASDEHLNGTGGTTFTRWDTTGFFTAPVRIFLAEPEPGRQACPRVAIHEMLHALGLYHARVGLVSRMQGIPAARPGYLNDFSPAPTFYDVAAIQILYDRRFAGPTTVAQLTSAGLLPPAAPDDSRELASRDRATTAVDASAGAQSTFSPPATRR